MSDKAPFSNAGNSAMARKVLMRAGQLAVDRDHERRVRPAQRLPHLVDLLTPQFADDETTEQHGRKQRQGYQSNQRGS